VNGNAFDAGSAVGRFTFRMSTKCDFAIGIHNSVAFIKSARQLMKERRMTFPLEEVRLFLSFNTAITLPTEWQSEKIKFIVGDALALPFPRDAVSSFFSLNLLDKVPSPSGISKK